MTKTPKTAKTAAPQKAAEKKTKAAPKAAVSATPAEIVGQVGASVGQTLERALVDPLTAALKRAGLSIGDIEDMADDATDRRSNRMQDAQRLIRLRRHFRTSVRRRQSYRRD